MRDSAGVGFRFVLLNGRERITINWMALGWLLELLGQILILSLAFFPVVSIWSDCYTASLFLHESSIVFKKGAIERHVPVHILINHCWYLFKS